MRERRNRAIAAMAVIVCVGMGISGSLAEPGAAAALTAVPAPPEEPAAPEDPAAPDDPEVPETTDAQEGGDPAEPPAVLHPSAKAALSCGPDVLYSSGRSGQLQEVVLNADRTSATVRNVGAAASGNGFNALGIGNDGATGYLVRYRETVPGVTGGQGDLYRFDASSASWRDLGRSFRANYYEIIAGAVDAAGIYWFGGFRPSDTIRDQFAIWSYDPGLSTVTQRGVISLRNWPTPVGQLSPGSDIAFDRDGNLYLVRGQQNYTTVDMFRVDADLLRRGTGTTAYPASARLPAGSVTNNPLVGIAFDSRGSLFVGGTTSLQFLTLPLSSERAQPLRLSGASFASLDLGTCAFPPTVKLQTELPNGRAAETDQFQQTLTAGGVQVGSERTTGNAPGVQQVTVGPAPVTSGKEVSFSSAAAGNTDLGRYGSAWQCVLDGNAVASGIGAAGSFVMPAMPTGSEVLCTVTHSVVQATKTAAPASGSDVRPGNTIEYSLEFDNSPGPVPAEIEYRDFLADVLDDAAFVDAAGNPSSTPAVTASGGLSFDPAQHWDAVNQRLTVRGTVPPGERGVLRFSVRVLPASDDGAGPAPGVERALIQNKLVRGQANVAPGECEPDLCTIHRVNSWTLEKGSVPAPGAELENGSAVHYRVTASKDSDATVVAGLQLRDDVTHVFKSAGWAPGWQAPPGARNTGLYLFDSAGRSLGVDGLPNSASAVDAQPARQLAAPELTNIAGAGEPADERWLLSSGEPLDMPASAVRAEMWFTVVIGESPVGVPDASTWGEDGARPSSGWSTVNYVTGMAVDGSRPDRPPFAPNACVTGEDVPDTSPAANAANPVDEAFPQECRVRHSVSENTFAIQKDAAGAVLSSLLETPGWGGDETGLAHLIGHEFEVRDAVSGGPSEYPSVRLCRTDYDPFAATNPWRGEWISAELAGDEARWAFGDAGAELQQRIRDWNNENPGAQLPQCATVGAGVDERGSWGVQRLGAGAYWLVETRAPDAQSNLAGTDTRPVRGVQLSAEAVPFTVASTESGGVASGGGQVDIGHDPASPTERCDPAASTIVERLPACVVPAGDRMLVTNAAAAALPFTGGTLGALLAAAGCLVLLSALAGAAWWRRRPHGVAAARHGSTEVLPA